MGEDVEALIVGMGPAGMAAAIELAKYGVQVAVVDENASPGGKVYRQSPSEFNLSDDASPPPSIHEAGQRLIDAFESIGKPCKRYSDTVVWGAFDDDALSIVRDNQIIPIKYKKLLLCEGAMERPLFFPGWTLPGIMTLGGVQKLVRQDRCLPGKRIFLAGCSPLLMPTAASIARAGGKVVAISDAVPLGHYSKLAFPLMKRKALLVEALGSLLKVFGTRIPTIRPSMVTCAMGDSRVEALRIAGLDRAGHPVEGQEQTFKADILGISDGFLPAARLARLLGCEHVYDRQQRCWKPKTDANFLTSKENVYIAGDSGGIAGREAAAIQGRLAATHLAASLNRLPSSEARRSSLGLENELARIMQYAKALNRAFSPARGLNGFMDRSTIVCRCEQVTVGDVIDGIEKGYRNINEIKRTRVGMGLCQGRTCEWATAQIMLQQGIPMEEIGYFNLRPPLSPMPFSVFEDYARTHGVPC
jgi:NADPH-dependent 2,4-dienoyl-CoA reductase/sulfur reductase-like enzyme